MEDGKLDVQIKISRTGIDSEKLRGIFQPSRTTKRQGIGLGLSIRRKIVDARGDEIRLESRVGEGVFSRKERTSA